MRREMIKAAVMAAASIMIVTGCGNSEKNVLHIENGKLNSVKTDDNAAENEGEVLSMWIDEEGSCRMFFEDDPDMGDEEYFYSYHIPQIAADTEGAGEINKELQDRYASVMSAVEEIRKNEKITWDKCSDYYEVEYQTFRNGDVISLIVTGYTEYDYVDEYAACYDVKKGRKLTSEEILELGHITEEEWLKGMAKAAADESDRELGFYSAVNPEEGEEWLEYWDGPVNMYMSALTLRASNISTERINSQVPIYLDQNGEAVGIFDIECFAGGGLYSKELKAQTSFEGKNFERSFDNVIDVKCEDGKITVTVEDCEWSREGYPSNKFEFGTPYEVGGILKDYVDCDFVQFDEGAYAVPVFLSDDGMVSYIDMVQGARCGYLCMTEPMPGFAELKELNGHIGEIKTVLERIFSDRGNYFDSTIMGISNYEWLETSVEHKMDGGGSYISNYSMGYATEDKDYCFLFTDSTPEVDLEMHYEGRCRFMGMIPEGKIFSYDISDGEGEYSGTFLLNVQETWNDLKDDYQVWADYQHLGGVDILDSKGEKLHLDKSESVG